MPLVTATGCALTALVGAFVAVTPEDPFGASDRALAMFKAAGSSAGARATGPGSFAVAFLDALHALAPPIWTPCRLPGMSRRLPDLSVYLVLDPVLCGGLAGMVRTATAAVKGGATVVQLRDKDAATANGIAAGRALKAARWLDRPSCAGHQRRSGGRAGGGGRRAACRPGRSGRGDGPRPARPGRTAGDLGAFCGDPAVDAGLVDYAGVGPVFATPTKTDAEAATGWDGLARHRRRLPGPVRVAIGGIKADHAAPAKAARSAGMAVVSGDLRAVRSGSGRPRPRPRFRLPPRRDPAGLLIMIANVLSIAGSDPSGGAGIQADIKAISARGCYAMAALTALTAQNTTGVTGIRPVPPDFVAEQIAAIFADIRVDAVKIGMIATAEVAAAVAEALAPHRGIPVVLDPVMVAKGGAAPAARGGGRDARQACCRWPAISRRTCQKPRRCWALPRRRGATAWRRRPRRCAAWDRAPSC